MTPLALQQAQAMAERPVIPRRRWAEELATRFTRHLESIGCEIEGEDDGPSQLQLTHIAESMGVEILALMAYARGLVPRARPVQDPPRLVSP